MNVALITGANKGIGLETARQLSHHGYTVYLGARDPERGEKAAAEVGARFVRLDVTDDASVTSALRTIHDTEGHLDTLVHNAGISGDGQLDSATALRVFDVNAIGIVRVTEAALPLLRSSTHPVVVTVSSSMGSFWAVTTPERAEYGLTSHLYAASKSAATMLTIQYAKSEPEIKFNAVEPGFTTTDMTSALGLEGGRSVEQSARVVVEMATIGTDGPSGTLQDENGPLNW